MTSDATAGSGPTRPPGSSARLRRRFDLLLIFGILGIAAALIVAIFFYVASIQNALSVRVFQERGDLVGLATETARLVEKVRQAGALKTTQTRQAAMDSAADTMRLLNNVRATYNMDNLIGTAAFYAVLNPALVDIQNWLRDGIAPVPPESDLVLRLVAERSIDVETDFRRLFDTTNKLTREILSQQASRLNNLEIVLMVTAVAIGLLAFTLVVFIRRRDRLEHELRLAMTEATQANTVKSVFMAKMSHELRTPLNAIIGFSDIIRQRMFGADIEAYASYGDDIHKSGHHLLEILNDVLDMAKLEQDAYQLQEGRVDPAAEIETCRMMMFPRAEADNVRVIGDVPPTLPRLWIDARGFRQILLNLISNAIKASAPDQVITVRARHLPGAGFQVAVIDWGQGIPADEINRIMRPFEQVTDAVDGPMISREIGAGLGLAISRTLMELHDGTLTLDSTLGEGTVATMTFPDERVLADDRADDKTETGQAPAPSV